MFGKTWLSGEATIVAVNIKRVSSDGLTPTREFAADVRIPGREPQRMLLNEARWTADFWAPEVGHIVNVLQDEKSGAVKFDMKDPRLSVKHHDQSRAGSFAAAWRPSPELSPAKLRQPGLPVHWTLKPSPPSSRTHRCSRRTTRPRPPCASRSSRR